MEQSHNQQQDNSMLYAAIFMFAILVLVVGAASFFFFRPPREKPIAQPSIAETPAPPARATAGGVEETKPQGQEYNITEQNYYGGFGQYNCYGDKKLKRVKIEPYINSNY